MPYALVWKLINKQRNEMFVGIIERLIVIYDIRKWK